MNIVLLLSVLNWFTPQTVDPVDTIASLGSLELPSITKNLLCINPYELVVGLASVRTAGFSRANPVLASLPSYIHLTRTPLATQAFMAAARLV